MDAFLTTTGPVLPLLHVTTAASCNGGEEEGRRTAVADAGADGDPITAVVLQGEEEEEDSGLESDEEQQRHDRCQPPQLPLSREEVAAAHGEALADSPSASDFVARLLNLHLCHVGSSALTSSDLTSHFLTLQRRLASFARRLPAFRSLTAADRRALLTRNSPLYLQAHLALHATCAGGGLQQVLSLLGQAAVTTPSSRAESELSRLLLTVTFAYFNGVTLAFPDPVWAHFYELSLSKVARLTRLFGPSAPPATEGLLAACALFHHDDGFLTDFDGPNQVRQAHRQAVSILAGESGCEVAAVAETLESLKSLVHLYAAHADLGLAAPDSGSSTAFANGIFEPAGDLQAAVLAAEETLSRCWTSCAWLSPEAEFHLMDSPCEAPSWVCQEVAASFRQRMASAFGGDPDGLGAAVSAAVCAVDAAPSADRQLALIFGNRGNLSTSGRSRLRLQRSSSPPPSGLSDPLLSSDGVFIPLCLSLLSRPLATSAWPERSSSALNFHDRCLHLLCRRLATATGGDDARGMRVFLGVLGELE